MAISFTGKSERNLFAEGRGPGYLTAIALPSCIYNIGALKASVLFWPNVIEPF